MKSARTERSCDLDLASRQQKGFQCTMYSNDDIYDDSYMFVVVNISINIGININGF